MFRSIAVAFALTTITPCITSELNAAEEDNGLIILDRKPWKISWVMESENEWVLLAHFDKGELRTYFKKAPPSKGLGLSTNNKPIKQEFKYYPSGQTFISKNGQFEQWQDGAKVYAFKYDKKFKANGNKFSASTTAIIEEVDGAPDEIRYAIYR